MKSKANIIKNLHLGISSIVIIVVALIYGANPQRIMPMVFDIEIDSIDLSNVFRAIMGLYLAFAIYWIVGIVRPAHWRNATLANIIFMGGLAFGRIISLILDGMSVPFSNGLVVELILLFWGIHNWKKYRR